MRQDIRLHLFNCGNSPSCHLLCGILPLPTPAPPLPPLYPPSPPPSSPHWNSAWHTDTAHSWHKAQRESEREKHTRTCTNRLVPRPLCLPSIHPVSRTKGPGNPIGISLPLFPVQICSNAEELCWQLSALCVFGDLLINLCVYVVCVGLELIRTNPASLSNDEAAEGALLPHCSSHWFEFMFDGATL